MRWFVVFTSSLVWPGALLHAQVPQLVNYQGRVAVGTENPVNFNGTGSFKFALVNTVSAPVPTTTSLWSNNGSSVAGSEPTLAVSLPVTKGLYSVLLGDTTVPGMTLAIPASVWLHADVRLRVWFNDGINGSQLLTPDQRLAPHGYLPDGSVSSTKLASGLTLAGTTTGTFSGSLSGNATSATTATTATAAGTTTNFSGALTGHVTGTQGATVVASVGGVNAANVGSGAILANAATPANTANTLVKRDASGNFAAGTITGSLSGNATTATSTPNFSGNLAGNVTGPQAATVVASVGGVTAANVAAGANLANTATTGTTPNTILMRDNAGCVFANTFYGSFTGSGALLTELPGSSPGSTLSLGGTLNLPATTSAAMGVITQSGTRLLHTNGGTGNFFAGPGAGNFAMTGPYNTGIGSGVLEVNTGYANTAIGRNALLHNAAGGSNTAIGFDSLSGNMSGESNTAIGGFAGCQNISGSNNISVGSNSGINSGANSSHNIHIGSAGESPPNPLLGRSGIIRIGTPGTHTDTYLAGGIHLGSGTGTTDPPNKPLIVRRANSLDNIAGEVVARTDKLRLERDGTSGGWRIAYEASPGNTTIAFTGLSAAGATVNFVTSLNSPLAANTVIVYTNAQNLISIRGTFGDSYEVKEQTEVSLTRYPGDYYWTGTITSTFNQ